MKRTLFICLILLSLIGCSNNGEDKITVNVEEMRYHFAEKIYNETWFIHAINQFLIKDHLSEIKSFSDGHLIGTQRDNFYHFFAPTVFSTFTNHYDDPQSALIEETYANILEIAEQLNKLYSIIDILNSEQKERLTTRLSNLTEMIQNGDGKLEKKTNKNLSFLNILQSPLQVTEANSSEAIQNFLSEINQVSDEIIEILNEIYGE